MPRRRRAAWSLLEASVAEMRGAGSTTTGFLEVVIANLRNATMRLVFFLEESPNELRSLVEFLNGQLRETEVPLVEARLYESPGGRIVVPSLFGYTEKARVAKRESRVQAAGQRSEIGQSAFKAAIAQGALPLEVKLAIAEVLEAWPGPSTPGWDFGVNAIFIVPLLPTRGLVHLGRNGEIRLYFGYWNEKAYQDLERGQVKLRDDFAREVSELFGIQFTDNQLRGFPSIKASEWTAKRQQFIALVDRLAS